MTVQTPILTSGFRGDGEMTEKQEMHTVIMKVTIRHPSKVNIDAAVGFFDSAAAQFNRVAPKGSLWENKILEED